MLHRLVIVATLAAACRSSAPPSTATSAPETPDTACPAAPASGALCEVDSPCDYDGRVRCTCTLGRGCPGGIQRPLDEKRQRRWVCGERAHPTCEATTTFTGACTDEGLRCEAGCYAVATCTGGQWQVQSLPTPQ